jgi:phage/plasmid-like protein (TIGR03299 family)
MSSNLSYHTDEDGNEKAEVFMGSNIPAWHGEGTMIDGRANAAQVMELAHLNWRVEKFPVRMDSTGLILPDTFSVERTDKTGLDRHLGTVGKQYVPVQNADQFGIFDGLIDRGEAIYETAGALGKGEKVWILAKLPDDIVLDGKDEIKNYLLLSNSHDGSSSFTAKLTPVRVVCSNTLSFALGGAGREIKIRHTAGAKGKIDEAMRVMGIAKQEIAVAQEAFGYMKNTMVDSTMVAYFLFQVLPASGKNTTKIENARTTVQNLFEGQGAGSDIAGKSIWGLYNAVAEYVDHKKNYRSNKLDAVFYGSGSKMTRKAFDVGLSLPKVSAEAMTDFIKTAR